MNKKDIAIIGGTFNPVHNGHIEMAKYFVDNYIVDEVWLLPSYISPLKNQYEIADFDDRVNMLRLASQTLKTVYISTFEKEFILNNKEYDKSYTYDVLNLMKSKYLNARFHFVVGFDSIKNINKWHNYKELLKDYWFYIFDRKDSEFLTKEQKVYYLDNLGKNFGFKFIYELFDVNISDISSTEIRNLLKDIDNNREELLNVMDINVINYIEEKRLYGV